MEKDANKRGKKGKNLLMLIKQTKRKRHTRYEKGTHSASKSNDEMKDGRRRKRRNKEEERLDR